LRGPITDFRVPIAETKMRTTVIAYLIAVVGLLILIFGVWGFIVLNSAEFGVPLTAYAIVFGLIGGGFAMIGVAQALRLLLVVVKIPI
jgi:hypothetical protein